ncbi:spore germination protein [Bacillus solimangrovi]|uniref:spore germination protein n=1 Tax=Bacillus solimangrovi TaxID=1305675 RepID=UPI0009F665D6|nr:spore germination protein [Bacillus solimangrovi]
MPSIICGFPININSVSGIVNFGDSLNTSPKITSKAITGSGGGNNGNFVNTNNGISLSNNFDPDVIDQPTVGNI